jgi:hypothetical protein
MNKLYLLFYNIVFFKVSFYNLNVIVFHRQYFLRLEDKKFLPQGFFFQDLSQKKIFL